MQDYERQIHIPSGAMLIEGSSMGVTNALQDLRKYEDADTEILRLMRKLYKFEEKNVETYKAFL